MSILGRQKKEQQLASSRGRTDRVPGPLGRAEKAWVAGGGLPHGLPGPVQNENVGPLVQKS